MNEAFQHSRAGLEVSIHSHAAVDTVLLGSFCSRLMPGIVRRGTVRSLAWLPLGRLFHLYLSQQDEGSVGVLLGKQELFELVEYW